jgi:membrane protease YdiL (CAAX protease family)
LRGGLAGLGHGSECTIADVIPERRRALAEVIICSGFPTQIALAGLLQGMGLSPLTVDRKLSPLFVLTHQMIDAVVLTALMVYFLRQSGDSPRAVFLGGRCSAREAALGAALLPATLALVAALLWLVQALAPWLHNVPSNPLEALLATRAGFVAFLFVAIVAGGLREELQRAFLLHRFARHLGGPMRGLIITSFAFGLGHTLQGWDAALATALLGLIWGTLYLRRRSAVGPIVNHALFNGTELVWAALR